MRRRRRKLRRLVVGSVVGLVLFPGAAFATIAVLDSANLAKVGDVLTELGEMGEFLQEQIDLLTEELEVVSDISRSAHDMVDAVGEATTIRLPFADLVKIGSQLQRDAMCLAPDLESLFPSLEFETLDWSGICGVSNIYRSVLFLDPSYDNGTLTRTEEIDLAQDVEDRRWALFEETAIKAVAGGDMAVEAATELLEASEELKEAADGSDDMNGRLAAIAQGQVLIAQGIAQQNLILGQLLKQQALLGIKFGLPVTRAPSGEDTDDLAAAPDGGGEE